MDDQERRPVVLVFFIESSGLKADGNRRGKVQASLGGLVETLGPADRAGIATFDSRARVAQETRRTPSTACSSTFNRPIRPTARARSTPSPART